MHLKDFAAAKKDAEGVVLGKGLLDVAGVLKALKDIKFPADGALSLEYEENPKNPIGEMNEVWIVARRSATGAEVRAEFAEVTEERISELRGLSTEQLDVVGWSPIGQVPLRMFMVIRVMDSWIHEQDVRAALGRPGGRDGFGEEVALARADTALGVVVGKGARAPEGASVAFEVTGALGGRRRIEVVDGRATPVDGAQATATVTLTQETYVRRFAGRISLDEAGDRALGEAALGALAVMV